MNFPTREQLVQHITEKMVNEGMAVKAFGEGVAGIVVDDVVLPALQAYGDLTEVARAGELVTMATARWIAANERQVAIINRLQERCGQEQMSGDLARTELAGIRTELALIEATAADLTERYEALTSTTPASETDPG